MEKKLLLQIIRQCTTFKWAPSGGPSASPHPHNVMKKTMYNLRKKKKLVIIRAKMRDPSFF